MHVGVHVCVARVRCRGCAALPPLLELPLPAHALAGRGGLDVAVLEQKADEKVAVARAVVERVVPLPKRVVRRQRAVDEVREQSVVEVGLADARRRRRVDRSLVVLVLGAREEVLQRDEVVRAAGDERVKDDVLVARPARVVWGEPVHQRLREPLAHDARVHLAALEHVEQLAAAAAARGCEPPAGALWPRPCTAHRVDQLYGAPAEDVVEPGGDGGRRPRHGAEAQHVHDWRQRREGHGGPEGGELGERAAEGEANEQQLVHVGAAKRDAQLRAARELRKVVPQSAVPDALQMVEHARVDHVALA
mmetsp:Transcript_20033/g.43279  ORF Transcript_20033/g.43279 Transcript_20033/m.43279 type:complete len:306 (+) Transcript_20033:711-1628(+)